MIKDELYDNVYHVSFPIIIDPYTFEACEIKTYKDTLENVVKRYPDRIIYVYEIDIYNGYIRYALSNYVNKLETPEPPKVVTENTNYKYLLIRCKNTIG